MLPSLLLLCLAASALAQLPHPCRTPDQFEGREHAYDPVRKFEKWARIAYDETMRRFREIEDLTLDTTRDYYDLLVLYNENKEYRLNLRTRQCNVTTPRRPWYPYSVPPTANFTGTVGIGAAGIPDEHVVANIFVGEQEGVEYTILTTSPDCFPITAGHSMRIPIGETPPHEERNFFDITPGIRDPMVFVPPSECLGEEY